MFLWPWVARIQGRGRYLDGPNHLISGLHVAVRCAYGAEYAVQGQSLCSRVMWATFQCLGFSYGFLLLLAPYPHPGFESENYHAEPYGRDVRLQPLCVVHAL